MNRDTEPVIDKGILMSRRTALKTLAVSGGVLGWEVFSRYPGVNCEQALSFACLAQKKVQDRQERAALETAAPFVTPERQVVAVHRNLVFAAPKGETISPQDMRLIEEGIDNTRKLWVGYKAGSANLLSRRVLLINRSGRNDEEARAANLAEINVGFIGNDVRFIASHEAYHVFGLRVANHPGWTEAGAVYTTMMLYKSSLGGNTWPKPESPLKCARAQFSESKPTDSGEEVIHDYNAAGEVVLETGPEIWAYLDQRYAEYEAKGYIAQPLVDIGLVEQWLVEKKGPAYVAEWRQKYPILYC